MKNGAFMSKTRSFIGASVFYIISTVFLYSCANPPEINTLSVESIKNTQEEGANNTPKDWPAYDDTEASKFIEFCHQDYDRAVSQFNFLEHPSKTESARDLLKAINQLDIVLDGLAGRSSLIRNVHPNAAVRTAGDVCQQKLMALFSDISLSRPIYNKLTAVKTDTFSAIDKRYVDEMIKDFQLSGVNQDEKTRNRIRELNDEILLIGQEFGSNIRDDVRKLEVTPEELDGLPQDFIDAHPVNENGRVTITTDYPDYFPVSQYATSDELRLKTYKQFKSRGYPANKSVLESMLTKRYELAQLLGFSNYAEYITANKMIGSAKNAADFIDKINRVAQPRSLQDYNILLKRLQKIDPSATSVGDWQKTYLENLIKAEVYKVDAQEVRQYFSYNNVRAGIFDLVEQMFNVSIEHWETEVWDPSVESYQILDNKVLDNRGKKALIGQFHLDMHPREGKYKHAAAFGVREGVKGIQTPISALVCNFPGDGDGSALMEHSQVETFLHEFGHLLHGLFGGHQPWLGMSGISTERDFVEAPSQMLEEWVWDADTLKAFARNAKGELIPDSLIEKMKNGRDYGKGIWTRHQMFYASISLGFYNQNPAKLDLDKTMKDLQAEYSPFAYVDDTYFYASFGHLNGYSAIYYTYMWSLVIASDMFSEFETAGLRNQDVAGRYRKYVLEPGGSKPAADLVADFLGRSYNFDAFAKQLNVDKK